MESIFFKFNLRDVCCHVMLFFNMKKEWGSMFGDLRTRFVKDEGKLRLKENVAEGSDW